MSIPVVGDVVTPRAGLTWRGKSVPSEPHTVVAVEHYGAVLPGGFIVSAVETWVVEVLRARGESFDEIVRLSFPALLAAADIETPGDLLCA